MYNVKKVVSKFLKSFWVDAAFRSEIAPLHKALASVLMELDLFREVYNIDRYKTESIWDPAKKREFDRVSEESNRLVNQIKQLTKAQDPEGAVTDIYAKAILMKEKMVKLLTETFGRPGSDEFNNLTGKGFEILRNEDQYQV